jgi:hypothetical protein
VEFSDSEATVNAMILNETPFKGRPLKITLKRTNLPGYAGGRGGRGAPRVSRKHPTRGAMCVVLTHFIGRGVVVSGVGVARRGEDHMVSEFTHTKETRALTHTYIYILFLTHMHTHALTQIHIRTLIRTHPHTRVQVVANLHARTCAYRRTHIHNEMVRRLPFLVQGVLGVVGGVGGVTTHIIKGLLRLCSASFLCRAGL